MKTQLAVAAAMVVFAFSPGAVFAAGDKPVSFEEMPDSQIKRVILSARAAERNGIETGVIDIQKIVLRQMVGGRVVPPVVNEAQDNKLVGGTFGGFQTAAADSQTVTIQPASAPAVPDLTEAWVVVTLSPDEWQRVSKDSPVRLLPLDTREGFETELLAIPAGFDPLEDPKRTMLNAYYMLPGPDHGLTLNQRVRVEMELIGTDEEHMVAPYSSIYYDGTGNAWVYTNPEPLVYERRPVTVDRIVGDRAILSEAPPVGSTVVTVGAALLYGAEVVFGK